MPKVQIFWKVLIKQKRLPNNISIIKPLQQSKYPDNVIDKILKWHFLIQWWARLIMNLWVKHVLLKHQNLNFTHKIYTHREVIVHRTSTHLLKVGSRACKITSSLCSAKELHRSLLCLIMGLKGETAWILCIANNRKRCTGACITITERVIAMPVSNYRKGKKKNAELWKNSSYSFNVFLQSLLDMCKELIFHFGGWT